MPNQHRQTCASTDDCDGAEGVFEEMSPQSIVHTMNPELNVLRAEVSMRCKTVCKDNNNKTVGPEDPLQVLHVRKMCVVTLLRH